MIDIHANNILFARLVIEILENKYNITFISKIIKEDEKWSTLTLNFNVNDCEMYVIEDIYYKKQVIDKLVTHLSEKINSQILKSYSK